MELRGAADAVQPFEWSAYDAVATETYRIAFDLPALLTEQAFLLYLQSCLPTATLQMR